MAPKLEIWGGLECTVARIRDGFRNQIEETGHYERINDLDLVAALGIKTLRYPVLWETISPEFPAASDFSWHDKRFRRLQELGMRPIAGLCHHGSGPRWTNMLDPAWPELLAQHARRVAERYPHLGLYTPVNEPLTTARFSGLYGHWYPHGKTYGKFLHALINECKATVLAMRAIREIRPDAQLVQTEDFGKVFSSPPLAYQADHENQRRWLTFDLLCGMVDRHHPWWQIFRRFGVSEMDLELFLEADAAPDIMGINHYLTSERYLDHRLSSFPDHCRGGNGRHRYADAEAVRMPIPHDDLGPAARLREVWNRYKRPIAITEAHHGCSRDEQLRWLLEMWNAAKQVRCEGVDVRAVTAWCLFGTVDWNSLLRCRNGHYEPGPFDVRGPQPRRTALAHATEALARTAAFDHPVLDRAGWWKRDIRFYRAPTHRSSACRLVGQPRQLLVTGATGTLGYAFSRICHVRGLDHVLVNRQEMDIADPKSVRAALMRHKPWAVVNTAGYVRVASAEHEPDRCRRENTQGTEALALACAELKISLLTFSSDLVFSGRKGKPYVESDRVEPSCVYGESKAAAERRVLQTHEQALIIRTSAFFGPWDRHNFVYSVLSALAAGRQISASGDVVSPTYVCDLVHEALNLLIDDASGIWHLTNAGEISWFDLAKRVAALAGYEVALIQLADSENVPRNTSLSSARGILMPALDGALERFMREGEVEWAESRRAMTAAE